MSDPAPNPPAPQGRQSIHDGWTPQPHEQEQSEPENSAIPSAPKAEPVPQEIAELVLKLRAWNMGDFLSGHELSIYEAAALIVAERERYLGEHAYGLLSELALKLGASAFSSRPPSLEIEYLVADLRQQLTALRLENAELKRVHAEACWCADHLVNTVEKNARGIAELRKEIEFLNSKGINFTG